MEDQISASTPKGKIWKIIGSILASVITIFLLTFWLQGNIFSTIALVLSECDNILSGSSPTGYTSTTRFATNCHSSWKEKKFCLLDLENNRGYDCADKESMNQNTEMLTVPSAQMANEGVSTFQNKTIKTKK